METTIDIKIYESLIGLPNYTDTYRNSVPSIDLIVGENVFMVAKIINTSNSNYDGYIEINGTQIGNTSMGNENILYLPISKGSSIKTKTLSGVSYNVTLYKMIV